MSVSSEQIPTPLFESIVSRLVPLFLEAAGGDPDRARQAVLEIIDGFQPTNFPDLLQVGLIVACSVSSTTTLMESMRTDLPHATVLRLQSTAISLSRTADRCRKLRDKRRETLPQRNTWPQSDALPRHDSLPQCDAPPQTLPQFDTVPQSVPAELPAEKLTWTKVFHQLTPNPPSPRRRSGPKRSIPPA